MHGADPVPVPPRANPKTNLALTTDVLAASGSLGLVRERIFAPPHVACAFSLDCRLPAVTRHAALASPVMSAGRHAAFQKDHTSS